MRLVARYVAASAFALAGLLSLTSIDGCGGKVQLPFCPQTPTISCIPSNRAIDTVKCRCTCLGALLAFNQPVCAQTKINVNTSSLASINAISGPDYSQEFINRCQLVKQELNNIIPGLLNLPCRGGLFGDYCDCNPTTGATFLGPTGPCAAADASCGPKTTCDGTTTAGFCRGAITFLPPGLDLSRCGCNQVSNCGADLPLTCPVTPGVGDPPSIGIPTTLVGGASTLRVDSPSNLTLTLGFAKAEGGNGQVVVGPTDASGEIRTFGRPHADGSADVLFDLSLKFKDTTFTVEGNTITLTDLIASGGLGTTFLSIGSNAQGTILMGTLNLIMDFKQNGTFTRINSPTIQNVLVNIDYKAKTFSIPSLPFNTNQGVAGTIALTGTIINQAPVAVVGSDQIVECTSPTGGSATLDGSKSFDVDSNVVTDGAVWHKGEGFGPQSNIVAMGLTPTITAPFTPPALTTPYTLSLADQVLQAGLATTNITVRDTTAPTLVLEATPSCLWAPNHKVVLYELGSTLKATVADTCDPNPTIEIVDVTSNQPDLGGGQGDFTPDIVKGTHAFCIRSEREGSAPTDRIYSIKVKVTDASMNSTTKIVTVTVPHDQAMAKCPKVDPSRLVDPTDSRCKQ